MDLTDIIQLVFLSGLIFFVVGYLSRPWLQARLQTLHNAVSSPHYLKSEGVLSFDDNYSAGKKKKS